MTGKRPFLITSNDLNRFIDLGRRTAGFLDSNGLWLLYLVVVHGSQASLYIVALFATGAWRWWAVGLLVPLNLLGLWLRNGQKLREVEGAATQSDAEDRVTLETVGNIRALLDDCLNLLNSRKTEAEFLESLARHQTQFMRSAIDNLRNRHGLGSVVLRASWMTREGDELVLRRFDNLAPERRTTRRLPVQADVPGAPEACWHGRPAVIDDTWDPNLKKWFPDPRPYRCILSVPVEDASGRCIGVLNIDANKPQVFRVSHATHLLETAYLVGLCEILSGGESSDEA